MFELVDLDVMKKQIDARSPLRERFNSTLPVQEVRKSSLKVIYDRSKFALIPRGGSTVILLPFWRIITGNCGLGILVSQSRKSLWTYQWQRGSEQVKNIHWRARSLEDLRDVNLMMFESCSDDISKWQRWDMIIFHSDRSNDKWSKQIRGRSSNEERWVIQTSESSCKPTWSGSTCSTNRSKLGIHEGDKWQFWKKTHWPFSIAARIIDSARGP